MNNYYYIILFLLHLFTTIPCFSQPLGEIIINNGESSTNSQEKIVDIYIRSLRSVEMLISNNSSFINSRWEKIAYTKKNWKLLGGDGLKTIYAKFRDSEGNVSDFVSASIDLDRIPPPIPEILVNKGLPYTNNPSTNIYIDGQEIHKMRISSRSDFLNTRWVPYVREIDNFIVSHEDGKKNVYAQFMDLAGNITETISRSIILDTKPPLRCRLVINDNDQYTINEEVEIGLFAEEASEMIIKDITESWVPYKRKITYKLPSRDGNHIIYAQFRDLANNTSKIVYDNINLDREAPSNAFVMIDQGARYINKIFVSIQFAALDAFEMIISLHEDFRDVSWIPYANILGRFYIADKDGEQYIYIKFRDEAGNETKTMKKTIILDRTPPKDISICIEYNGLSNCNDQSPYYINKLNPEIDIKLKSEEAYYMMLSNTSNFYGIKWVLYKEYYDNWKLIDGEGEKTVYTKYRDRASNISSVVSSRVIVDTRGPVNLKFFIDKNQPYCNNKDAIVDLGIFAHDASLMRVSNNQSFVNSEWENYEISKKWVLDNKEDGEKKVFIQFKDIAGNLSNIIEDGILLDRMPPQEGNITINRGENSTNNPDKVVILKLRCLDVLFMQISNETSFSTSRWEPFSPLNINWRLDGDDGLKKVYVRFKDEVGNISLVYSDEILLDRSFSKEVRLEIESDRDVINNSDGKVILSLYADEASEMIIDNYHHLNNDKWEPYSPKKEWQLLPEDGMKIVYAIFKDENGNLSNIAYDKIGIDTNPPEEGKIKILGKDGYITNFNKYANLRIWSNKDALEMMISNYIDFRNSKWIKYDLLYHNWILEGDDGEKTVYLKLRDRALNETIVTYDKVILDRQSPYNEKIVINDNLEYTNNKYGKAKLKISSDDASYMRISNSKNLRWSEWEPYQTIKNWILNNEIDGLKKVYIQFKDDANNLSDIVYDDIILDTHPPEITFFTVKGDKNHVSSIDIVLYIKAKDIYEMMISNSIDMKSNIWEPYTSEKKWKIPSRKGVHYIYMKARDRANNEISESTYLYFYSEI